MVRFPYRLNTYTKKNDHPLWVAILFGGDEGNRLALPFFRNGNYGVVAVETGDKQQSTGLLHLNGFDSHFTNKRTRLTGGFFY